jgi:hypothetical protein
MPARSDWRAGIAVAASVLVALAAAKVIGRIPKPLCILLAATFLAWAAAFVAARWTWRKPSSGWPFWWLATWISTTGFALGVVYYLDPSGWIWLHLTGYDVVVSEEVAGCVDRPLDEFVAQHPVFVIDPQDCGALLLPRGTYNIGETVVVPGGSVLKIEPGTVLRFAGGCSLISYSPVVARGTERQPILLTARNRWRKWGALGVVDAGQSVFRHVYLEHGRRALVNHLDFPGSLSLIRTDVEIADCRFERLGGKDAVYVREGHVSIRTNLFRDVYMDGLDLDGGSGEVSGNRFIDCRDEGIDLSGTDDVRVFGNVVLDQRGGRIAADGDVNAILAQNTLGYSR